MITGNNGTLFARYATEKGKITSNGVKPKLFEPRKDRRLSVQAIDDLDYLQIKACGERVAKKSNRKLYGWAKITRSLVEGIKLKLHVDNNPCPGHAIISGWPEQRNAIRDKQKELANNSRKILLRTHKQTEKNA